MFSFNSIFEETHPEIELDHKSETEDLRDLVVYNDDVNTFDFVIDCFVEICRHDRIQAEQCTFLVHYKGKCSVKRGASKKLEAVCSALLERGLTAKIE